MSEWKTKTQNEVEVTQTLKIDGGDLWRTIITGAGFASVALTFVPCCRANVMKIQQGHDEALDDAS